MANKCNLCGKFLSMSTDGAKCTKCVMVYHRSCAPGFDAHNPSKWMCQLCREKCSATKKSPTTDNNATTDEPFLDANMTTGDVTTPLSLAEEIRLLRVEMASARRKMASFRHEITQLNLSMADFRAANQPEQHPQKRVFLSHKHY
ncbi:unnamed protein product [Euphydryas editha]|uniref:Phorbol-ester/DAG-type domain-containing protein n=1 Tax=Euphydryas editha TaxID=104508 RepID=A0AAU9U440_EUPED|nr:unnamed protein product [Euphydryas editha]